MKYNKLRDMKRLIIFAATLLICVGGIKAQPKDRPTYPQNEYCPGLKNPSNFTFSGNWSGFTGNKLNQLSTCTTPGANFTTPVPAAMLESTTSSVGCVSTSSTNIDGVSDQQKRFVIKGPGNDPLTSNQLPYLPPDTSFHTSIRLGNSCYSAEAEMLIYTMNVNANNALLTIWYAMSLEDARHSTYAQNPEFAIIVEKQRLVNGVPVPDTWDLAYGDTLCYVQASPTSGQSQIAPFIDVGSNVYKPWDKVMINLYNFYGQTVRIKISAGDCQPQGHYGYCYFAGECQPQALRANGCAAGESDEVARIKAPKGANAYAWYRSKTGVLNGSARDDDNNYVLIPGATDDSLNCMVEHFVTVPAGDTVTQSTFMCKMTTRMNVTAGLDVISKIVTNVGNTKPAIIVDSVLDCGAGITLTDLSRTPYAPDDENEVDHGRTTWRFYRNNTPAEPSLDGTYVGDTVSHTFDEAGNYCVRVRVSAFDTTCWNEKTIDIRTIKSLVPRVYIERNNLCRGDKIAIQNQTIGRDLTWSEWTFRSPLVDTTYVTSMPVTEFVFDTTTQVTMRTRTASYYMADTTGDGLVERVHCYSDTTFTIYVQEYPKLRVDGDTIVCKGDHSDVQVVVTNNIDNCDFDWYYMLYGTTPFIEDNAHLSTTLTEDRKYFVKVTTPFGCENWDSIMLYLVNPSLEVDIDKICTGDTATLTAGRAAYFEWTSNPPDPDLNAQGQDSVIKVSPEVTTVYSVVGHGSNGCGATALSKKITVYPYPIMAVKLTPDYIDSENPSVQFSDISENGASSLWNFGNGETSTTRSVVHTFTDLSQDSIRITLETRNAIGCPNDTAFYVQVGIFAVWFPNAFTPKLETNNLFKPFTANKLEDYELYIYDRGGALVFSTTDVEEGWDGTYNGTDCKQGAYVYIATYRREGVERLMSQKGTIMLLR